MIIEIDDGYIRWVKESNPEFDDADVTDYINEVLSKHKETWGE